MKRAAAAMILLTFVSCVASLPSVDANWSMFRSNPTHSGVGTANPKGNNVQCPTQLWKTNITWELTETEIQSKTRSWKEPAVADGVVYVCASSAVTVNRYQGYSWIDVYAFNAKNGAEIWNYRDSSCQRVTPPAVTNGLLYFATDRYVCALKASDGSLVWNYSSGTFVSYPAVFQDRLFIGSGKGSEGTLLALNANNGHSLWNYTNVANSRSFSSPAVANGVVYVGSYDENMYALDGATGDKLWNYSAGDFHPAPAVAKGIVYAITSGANIYALDALNGGRIWNYSIYDDWLVWDQPYFAISNEVVYARNGLDKLYALDAISGVRLWNLTFGKSISAPTVVNDVVYLGSENALYALNAHNGAILWNYTTGFGFGSPVVANSVAYVDSGDEQVYAIAVPSPMTTEPQGFPVVLVVAIVTLIVVSVCVGLFIFIRRKRRKEEH